MKLKTKICLICGKEYASVGRQKWCLGCKKQAIKEYDKQRLIKKHAGVNMHPTKICINCGKEYLPTTNAPNKWCPDCRKIGLRDHFLRLEQYGMTKTQYEEMLAAQSGKCAVCGADNSVHLKKNGTPRSLQIDHDHKTGKVRGLLCTNCNSALGHVHDNPGVLMGLVEYLKNR